ncbi:MAG: peptidylprolyl isomerase [Deltaproteobacteria bacterium]|nr:peptidylprolyl isomerase [Deltaproteobacteria bacterium]
MKRAITLSLMVLLSACSKKAPADAEGSGALKAGSAEAAAPAAAPASKPAEGSGANAKTVADINAMPGGKLDSKEILARPAGTESVLVQHILISGKAQGAIYAQHNNQNPRAAARDEAAVETLVNATVARIAKGEDFKALMTELSEDPGSNKSGMPYPVDAQAPMVPPFKDLAMRLKLDEIGVVASPFGYHIMKRVTPPPPDAAESADILARTEAAPAAKVQHVLISFKEKAEIYAGRGGQDPRAAARSQADARKLVADLAQKGAKGDFVKLMKDFSEDPGSSKTGEAYEISPQAQMVPGFLKLGLRLKVGEVGIVLTEFGYHVMKRTE